ncbi:hypothetical protein ASE61_13810 [Bosea sp. Root670]|nr:hypothetical protein ASE61_13810 [Bosea sp. Root670]
MFRAAARLPDILPLQRLPPDREVVMTLGKFLMIAGVAGATLATSVLAQSPSPRGPPCADRNHVVGQLRDTFGERMIGSGLAESGVLFELYVGANGSWTLLATVPTRRSCLIGSGEAWEPLPTPEHFAAQ